MPDAFTETLLLTALVLTVLIGRWLWNLFHPKPTIPKYESWEPEVCSKCNQFSEQCVCDLYGEDDTDEWLRKP